MQTDRSCVELVRFVAPGAPDAKSIPPTLVVRLDLIVRGAWCHEVCDVSDEWQGAAWHGGMADDSCAGWSGAEAGHGEGRSGLRRGTSPLSGDWLGGLLGLIRGRAFTISKLARQSRNETRVRYPANFEI